MGVIIDDYLKCLIEDTKRVGRIVKKRGWFLMVVPYGTLVTCPMLGCKEFFYMNGTHRQVRHILPEENADDVLNSFPKQYGECTIAGIKYSRYNVLMKID